MASVEKVTVDKSYFDALLRRADCHNATQNLTSPDPANVTISQAEYNSLLRVSQEYELLKNALFQGGVTAETLELLISAPQNAEQRIDSAVKPSEQWNHGNNNVQGSTSDFGQPKSFPPRSDFAANQYGTTNGNANSFNPGNPATATSFQQQQSHRRVPSYQRQVSYGMTFVPEDIVFDGDDADEGGGAAADTWSNERRTLFFSGLSERTTYRDMLSVIHSGKVLNIHLRQDRTALVTFVDGAIDFLAWTKRNDIYLHNKRIEVKWADRQYPMNAHIAHKVASGASRNILVKSATEKGLSEHQIRDDMEHIHNLIIIDVVFRNGDAFISTNSVHNALFARTCMMSRTTYKGCKIEFFRDECDVPAPMRPETTKVQASVHAKTSKPSVENRFNMLNLEEIDGADSDEENHTPSEDENSDVETVDNKNGVGVSLRFFDA